MADYPGAVYSPRTKENLPGIVYDAAKKTIGYVEDITKLDDEVVATQTELGLNPKGTSADVAERIKGLKSLSDANADVITIKGDRIGIKVTSPITALDILASAVAAREALFHCQVSDAPNDRFAISNATGVANRFAALLLGSIESTETNLPIAFIAQTDFTRDAGGIPYMAFIARKYPDGQDWNNPASGFSNVATRPIIAFRNKGTVLMQVMADGKIGVGTTGPTALLDVNSNILRLRTAKTPASAGAAGNAGDICWDANYIYVCVATNTWKRVAIATW